MKPRKSYEPDYRFGGNPADFMKPAPLGTKVVYGYPKPKRKKVKVK